MSIINSQQMRAIWKSLKEQTGQTPQVGFIRLEQLADGSKSIYSFPVKQSSGSVLPTEVRLNDNDAIFAKYARLRLKSELPTKPGSGEYVTFANQTALPVVALETVAQDLDSLWNSKLQILIDQKEELKAVDMNASRVVRTTQQSAATNRSEIDSYDGYIDLHSIIRIGGSASVDINLIMPAYPRLIQYVAGANRVYLSLELYGFLVPNGSALGQVSMNY